MGIVTAVIVVVIIGLIVAVVLAVASVFMAVPTDEKVEKLTEALPGANCGSCGFSGCSGYALALSNGEAKVGLCSPGGNETAKALSEILGVDTVDVEKKVAIVHCIGNDKVTDKSLDYSGIKSCAAAMQLYSGGTKCTYGCIGYGDCANVCTNNAIDICSGVAVVNTDLCGGCGLCEKTCPKSLIKIKPLKKQAIIRCSNCDKGNDTRKACTAGCIGCMRCVKVCENNAIKIENFHAVINSDLCTGCGKCIDECKLSCIQLMEV